MVAGRFGLFALVRLFFGAVVVERTTAGELRAEDFILWERRTTFGPFLHAWCSLCHLRLVGVRVAEHLGLAGRAHSLSGFAVSGKPVVVHLTLLLRYATDDHRGLPSSERIVIDFNRRSRDVRSVFSITSPVHVKTMAQRDPELDVMSGHVTVSGPARACDRVPIPIEQVVLEQRRCRVVTYTIAQTLILAMVDMVVMDVMPLGCAQVHARVGETRYLTVIHFKTGVPGCYAIRGGEFVVVFMSPTTFAE